VSGPVTKQPLPPFRVLHLISSAGFLGAENVALELAVQSRAAGLHVSIAVLVAGRNPNTELAEAARSREIPVTVHPCAGRLDAQVINIIRQEIDGGRIDVLHSHNYKSNFYAWRALRGTRCAWVITNHGRRSGFRLLLYNLADAYVARHADRVVAVSDRIARKLRFAGVRRDSIRVIDNGIDTKRFMGNGAPSGLRASLGIPCDAQVVGTIGSLTREKGHTCLIRAVPRVLERFPSAYFLVIGDGPERDILAGEAEKLGIRERIVFTGSRTDIPHLLKVMDLFAFPSLLEGLPMALLEAQAAGVPTVATTVGAIPRVIVDGVTGLLVPPGNPATIADSISRLLENPDAARAMAAAGVERVRDTFSADVMARKYLDLYREILGDKEGRS
jgi:glycosyltransferase involved in cell wall biosynthesis